MTFKDLQIIDPILRAIETEGYQTPSPIQEGAIPILLEGHDLLASAQTGTGKTAAFAIPIIQLVANSKASDADQEKRIIRALILAPTRELAEQIKQSFRAYSGKLNIKVGAIYGGASQRAQEGMLNRGIDILIATPGRLIDLMNQKIVKLETVEHFVLDEADTLLDMGFIKDVKFIKGFIPKTRQTMMFSATFSSEVMKLAGDLLNQPKFLDMAPPEMMIEKINHSLFYVEKKDKFDLLLDLLTDAKLESVLVFMRTKHTANKLVERLMEYGVRVDAIHGNKSQNARQIALNDFKDRKIRVLIATDIAARGIDIDDLTHVINFDLPDSPETYVHRIGRTGRRGLSGEAYTFCSKVERSLLKAVEKHTGLKLKEVTMEPISEDSKFKKIVPGEKRDNDRPQDLIVADQGDRPSDRKKRNARGAKEEGKYKPKKDKGGNMVDNAPSNFGKQKKVSRDKKKAYQSAAEIAFDDFEAKDKKRRSKLEKSAEFAREASPEDSLNELRREFSSRSSSFGGRKDGQRRTGGRKPSFGHRQEGERHDDRRSDRKPRREGDSYQDKPSFGERSRGRAARPDFSDRPREAKGEGERRAYVKRDRAPRQEGEKRSYGSRDGERSRDFVKRDRAPRGEGEKRTYGSRDGSNGRDYVKRDRAPRQEGEKRSYGARDGERSRDFVKRDRAPRGEGEKRSYGAKDGAGKRDYAKRDRAPRPEGEKRSFDKRSSSGFKNGRKPSASRSYQGRPKARKSF